MATRTLRTWYDRTDSALTWLMARYGVTLLRISMGIIFFWFGALKLVPGLSPAEGLIRASMWFLPLELFIPFLGIWEILIGLGFITGRYMRLTILLLFLQMPGTLSPAFLAPDQVFKVFPFGLTLEGQYMVKNLILISAGIVLGSTVRGGGLVSDPGDLTPSSRPPAPPPAWALQKSER